MDTGPADTESPIAAPITKAAYIASVERDGAALVAAGHAGLDASVAACPGWTVGTVLGHLGRVYRSVSLHIERRATAVIPSSEIPKPPSGDELHDWYATGLDRVLGALRSIEPDEYVWSWSTEQNGGFYHRRMAHETAVHRWDAQAAHGAAQPFDSDLAADGVDELYRAMLATPARGPIANLPSGSLHLHRTDGVGEWTVRNVDGAVVTTIEHGKGDAAVRGPASDLLVFAWNRGIPDTLAIFGDEAVARAWSAVAP
jgi:uncharacterized protein (TIGR03083 family)